MKRRIFSLLLVCFLVVTSLGGGQLGGMAAKAADAKPTIWVVGDSTVSAFTDNYYYPRYGYGTQIANYMDDTYEVKNLASSGRSSKNFPTDANSKANYQTLIAGMKKDDVLIIGFGHNDEKADEPARYTSPTGDYKTEGSFAKSLYDNYVKPAQDVGAKPIICTPIVRRTPSGTWKESELHVANGGSYPQAIIDMGKTLNIPVVDMTSLTKELYDTLTPAETLYLHAWTGSKSDSVDNTHTNIYGAKYNAYMLTQAIKDLNIAGVSEHVKADATAPTKEKDLVPNPDYKEPEYDPNLKPSSLGDKAGIWNPTAFGNLGGSPNKTNIVFSSDGNSYTINVKDKGGKIASGEDGIVMYYCRVPSNVQFTLTAKATVADLTDKQTSFLTNGQSSFGLMARDDMYIDTNNKDVKSDYVAAGPLYLDKFADGGAANCFKRSGGKLTAGGVLQNNVELNKTYDLKIASNTDGYACTFGEEETVTGGFDFKLTSIDSKYVYVGMYTARATKVIFSDVHLLIDGVEVTPENVEELTTYKESPTPDPEPTPDPDPEPKVLLGDVDGNGKIETSDGIMIKKHLAEMKVEINTTNSDVNNDKKIDTTDAVMIMKKLANMEVGF